MTRKKPDQESFPGVIAPRPVANDASPVSLLSDAIQEHFAESDPHFCQAACSEDLLIRMNSRALYIVTETTLTRLHAPCLAEVRWYRDALVTIRDDTSLLKPDVVAKLALDRNTDRG